MGRYRSIVAREPARRTEIEGLNTERFPASHIFDLDPRHARKVFSIVRHNVCEPMLFHMKALYESMKSIFA
jgi:hypothetical protein